MRINLDELLNLAAKIETARAAVKTQAKTLLHVSEKANRLEAELRALIEGEPEVESEVEPELRTGPDTGSNIKTRPWRNRAWHRSGSWVAELKEYRYSGADYIRQAKRLGRGSGPLGLGSAEAKTREVWLTEEEIPTVREAVYTARLAKGLKTGVPRNRLVLVGGE